MDYSHRHGALHIRESPMPQFCVQSPCGVWLRQEITERTNMLFFVFGLHSASQCGTILPPRNRLKARKASTSHQGVKQVPERW
jgi:hypothetical protein